MPTKKIAKSKSSKNGGEKKPGSRKPAEGILQPGPPIIVGGGGSLYVWIRREFNPAEIPLAQVPASASKPSDPASYRIYRCDANIRSAILLKGDGSVPTLVKGLHPGRHVLTFDTVE
jgi:hypothetical protein